jgi:hypothetical protein
MIVQGEAQMLRKANCATRHRLFVEAEGARFCARYFSLVHMCLEYSEAALPIRLYLLIHRV